MYSDRRKHAVVREFLRSIQRIQRHRACSQLEQCKTYKFGRSVVAASAGRAWITLEQEYNLLGGSRKALPWKTPRGSCDLAKITIERLGEQMAFKTGVSERTAGRTDHTQEEAGWMDEDNEDDKTCGRTDEVTTIASNCGKNIL